MRLLILGATGRTGQALIEQALGRGHQLTALARSPEKLGKPRPGLVIRQVEIQSSTALARVLPAHDAVVSALGHSGLGGDSILTESARALVVAMRESGVRRILVVSVGILFEHAGMVPTVLRRTLLRNVAVDSQRMERILIESDLDWTIARPPRLTNGPLTRRYRVAVGAMPAGSHSMSRANVADFLLNEVEQAGHVRQIVGLAASQLQELSPVPAQL
jgi:putative NADH-flavin reductase